MLNEHEIVMQYRQAKYSKRQIGILADLNATNKAKIIEVLKKHNAIILPHKIKLGSGRKPDFKKRELANKLYNENYTYREIAKKLGVPIKTLYRWYGDGILIKE